MNHLDFDYDIVDPNANEQSAPIYAVAQWLNGQQTLKALGGVQYTGGLVLPDKYLLKDFKIPNWTPAQVTFRSGKQEGALTAQRAVIAPIRTRFRWFVNQGGVITYFPRSGYAAGANMRGHLQVLAAINGLEDPIGITFKGKASQTYENLLKDFSAKVVQVANKLSPKGKMLPRYAFWMTIAPGPHAKAGHPGQESVVTLPTLVLPQEITKEYLRSIYVGRENLIRFQEIYLQAEPWVNAWEKTDVEQTESPGDIEEETDAEPQPRL